MVGNLFLNSNEFTISQKKRKINKCTFLERQRSCRFPEDSQPISTAYNVRSHKNGKFI